MKWEGGWGGCSVWTNKSLRPDPARLGLNCQEGLRLADGNEVWQKARVCQARPPLLQSADGSLHRLPGGVIDHPSK